MIIKDHINLAGFVCFNPLFGLNDGRYNQQENLKIISWRKLLKVTTKRPPKNFELFGKADDILFSRTLQNNCHVSQTYLADETDIAIFERAHIINV